MRQAVELGLCLVLWLPSVSTGQTLYSDRQDVRAFVDALVREHRFNRAELLGLFRHAQTQENVLEAIARPAERELNWSEYRPIFVTDSRTRGGVEFWTEHAETLSRAEAGYGVPAEIIVAIIGVETRYGRHTGRHPVFESLTTLGFDYEKRGAFFRSELEHFLLLARDERFDPTALKGSYAGAMGLPQFISSSYRAYAVDFDGDGRRDLWDSTADAIGSVANYFKRHGWRRDEPVVMPAEVDGDVSGLAVGRGRQGLKPEHRFETFKRAGVRVAEAPDAKQRATLIELETHDGREYWLGLKNFYVITRYNHSAMYAMAVYQLSRAIAREYQRSGDVAQRRAE